MQKLPQEFLSRMEIMLGDEYAEFLQSYGKDKIQGLRINSLKCDGKAVFDEFDLRPIAWCDSGYYFNGDDRPGKSVLHEGGAFYIQEPSAMAVVESMDVREGDTVLDLCAAPGGKSSQIACKLQGSGLLISNEIIPSRAKILSQNIERMGVRNCVVLNQSPSDLAKRLKGVFDRILVDAPCSGEGMFRKNPLAVDEWSPANVENCKQRQLDILDSAVEMLKDGGVIVYSTCTFSKQENEEVIDEFLQKYEDFEVAESKFKFCDGYNLEGSKYNDELVKTNRIFPHKFEGEGHFFAVLKNSRETVKSKYSLQQSKADLKAVKEYKVWQKENLIVEFDANLSFGQTLYAMPDGTPRLDGFKVERVGLQLGQYLKNRFEPSHALAMAIGESEVKRVLPLDKQEAEKYLSGQTLDANGIKGWALATYNGVSLGWCKCDGAYAKNHYPKGLRKQ
ncbi:MAG: RsmF rRNA methyltransferase first C-terminal domain-containing protein [Clostridia bacterium]|nr:RsmF rRNA methyltransferase first C-terminal domain-containing protein [Clostridia bacterium]